MVVKNKTTDIVKNCEKCGGTGYLPLAEDDPEFIELVEMYGNPVIAQTTTQRCECLLEQQFRSWVGKPIYEAEIVEESPLTELIDEDIFISASHREFLAHIRYVLERQPFTFFWKAVSDAELRDIFVGNDEKVTAISNIVRNPELMIIRLGVLSYKNVAMPGLILEALRIRQMEGKPSWVVNPKDKPFNSGHLAWSGELEYFLGENFKEIAVSTKSSGKAKIIKNDKSKAIKRGRDNDLNDISNINFG